MAEYLDGKEIRNIILNAHKIKEFNKCPKCEGTGWEHWNGETGDNIKPGHAPYDDEYPWDEGECERCYGIGYLDILMYGN